MVQSKKAPRNMHMKNAVGQTSVKSYLKFKVSLKDFQDQRNDKNSGPQNPWICSDRFYLHTVFIAHSHIPAD